MKRTQFRTKWKALRSFMRRDKKVLTRLFDRLLGSAGTTRRKWLEKMRRYRKLTRSRNRKTR